MPALLRSYPTRALPAPAALLLLLFAACGAGPGDSAPISADGAVESGAEATDPVRPGIDVLLSDSLHLIEGRRVGLVTNHTGIDREGVSSIDRLHGAVGVELVALYSPEHGIRGTAEAGELVDHTVDDRTGLPVHSLYGDTRKPTPEMLEGVDVLLFDILDIGARYYTYIYTMALAMEAAGEAGIPFVVLDRPNAIGGWATQGNILDPAFSSFVGMYPIPIRHGLTPGELARVYRGEFGVVAELHVVPVEGLRRTMDMTDTGLPWTPPSPNMPSLESAYHYPGTCLFEGTNLSVGRGTDRAFQQIGAPWLDAERAVTRLEALGLDGVRFEAVTFVPTTPGDGKFAGEEVRGIRLHVTDRERYNPTRAGVALLSVTRALARGDGESADRWEWRTSHFDRLAGTDVLREGLDEGRAIDALVAGWDEASRAFGERVEPYRIYP
ncbi:MAG: DUF1343 domain-containing protein [Gemmatimonadales bacterium]|nr:MAG: DUF1343 domain-containing protein [Gemmatimonadales bacterium]